MLRLVFVSVNSGMGAVSQEWLLTGVGDREANEVDKVDDKLIAWLNKHPEIISELRMRSGLD